MIFHYDAYKHKPKLNATFIWGRLYFYDFHKPGERGKSNRIYIVPISL